MRFEVTSVKPVHPGHGEPSRIEIYVALTHLKSEPVLAEILSEQKALKLAGQLIAAISATQPRP